MNIYLFSILTNINAACCLFSGLFFALILATTIWIVLEYATWGEFTHKKLSIFLLSIFTLLFIIFLLGSVLIPTQDRLIKSYAAIKVKNIITEKRIDNGLKNLDSLSKAITSKIKGEEK